MLMGRKWSVHRTTKLANQNRIMHSRYLPRSAVIFPKSSGTARKQFLTHEHMLVIFP